MKSCLGVVDECTLNGCCGEMVFDLVVCLSYGST
jgi:hypothetical protein